MEAAAPPPLLSLPNIVLNTLHYMPHGSTWNTEAKSIETGTKIQTSVFLSRTSKTHLFYTLAQTIKTCQKTVLTTAHHPLLMTQRNQIHLADPQNTKGSSGCIRKIAPIKHEENRKHITRSGSRRPARFSTRLGSFFPFPVS